MGIHGVIGSGVYFPIDARGAFEAAIAAPGKIKGCVERPAVAFAGNDIDDTSDRVAAIEGGLAAFQDLHSFNFIAIDEVQVKGGTDAGGVIGGDAIDQDQGLAGTGALEE